MIDPFEQLRVAFGLDPVEKQDANDAYAEGEETEIENFQDIVRIHLQRLKGNKEATLVKGLTCGVKSLELIGRELKQYCGVGGSVKDGEIILQGNQRQKTADYLIKKGYRNVKLAGA